MMPSITHAPLVAALEIKAATGTEQQRRVDELEDLAAFGDQGAALTLFLLTSEAVIAGDIDQRARVLAVASDRGYALASFYLALHLKDSADMVMTENTPEYDRYRRTLALAQEQGLSASIVQPLLENIAPEGEAN